MISTRSTFGSLAYRAMGAAMLDRGTYEGIEHDSSATFQAAAIVVGSSLAAGIGASQWSPPRPGMLIAVAGLALVTWIAWAVLILQIGGRILAERQTEVDLGQLLRTVGFAASPGFLQVFAFIPTITAPVYAVSWLWMLAAMTVAVRQALDFRTFGRALAVCGLAFALVLVTAFALALMFVRSAASS